MTTETKQSIQDNFSFNNYYSVKHQYGIKNAIDKICNKDELINLINENEYFYFEVFHSHASTSFNLKAIENKNLNNNTRLTKNQLLNKLKNR